MDKPKPSSNRFNDGKAPDAMRTIGEVSAAFGIKPHVLRYWEQQFPTLQPLKRSGGRRLYRPDDVALVGRIDDLVNSQGYTLKGALKTMREKADSSPQSEAVQQEIAQPVATSQSDASTAEVQTRLRSIRTRLSAALAS